MKIIYHNLKIKEVIKIIKGQNVKIYRILHVKLWILVKIIIKIN